MDYTDHWLEVTGRPGHFRWALFRTGRRTPYKRSSFTYRSRTVARIAGERVLTRILDRLNT